MLTCARAVNEQPKSMAEKNKDIQVPQVQGTADIFRGFMVSLYVQGKENGEVRTIQNETTYPIHGKYPLNQFFATDVHRPTRTAWSSVQVRVCFFAFFAALREKKPHPKDPPLSPSLLREGNEQF